MTETRYRQEQQVIELERFHREGVGRHLHPDPALYGSGWGDPFESPWLRPVTQAILHACIHRKHPGFQAVEIGPGGGRWTAVLASALAASSKTYQLTLFDGTTDAFERTNAHLKRRGEQPAHRCQVCPDGRIEGLDSQIDLVFSFDVFVHFTRELIYDYVHSVARILKPGGQFLVSFACEFPDDPNWTCSDEWYEYVMRYKDGVLQYDPQLWSLLETYFDKPAEVHLMHGGFGSAFLRFVRNENS